VVHDQGGQGSATPFVGADYTNGTTRGGIARTITYPSAANLRFALRTGSHRPPPALLPPTKNTRAGSQRTRLYFVSGSHTPTGKPRRSVTLALSPKE
jgi:hypothetical protein